MTDGTEQVGRIAGFNPTKLKELRTAREWTPSRLAAEVGVKFKTLGTWEAGGRTPSPQNLVQLARALDVYPADLISTPRDQWTLVNLRQVAGLPQWRAAKLAGISSERLLHMEDGADPLTPELTAVLATNYRTIPAEITACWQRGRNQLTHPRSTSA